MDEGAVRLLQSRWRSAQVKAEIMAAIAHEVAEPSLALSQAAQHALLPKDQFGNLLPLCCSLECFRCFGSGVYTYMIWMRHMTKVFIAAALVNLPTAVHNGAGSRLSEPSWMTINSLGNVEGLNGSYGPTQLLTTLILLYALVRGSRELQAAEAEVQASDSSFDADDDDDASTSPGLRLINRGYRGGSSPASAEGREQEARLLPAEGVEEVSRYMAARYGKGGLLKGGSPLSKSSVMITGLPRWFGQSVADTEALREYLGSRWGDVPHITVARTYRVLLLRMRARRDLVEKLCVVGRVEPCHVHPTMPWLLMMLLLRCLRPPDVVAPSIPVLDSCVLAISGTMSRCG